MGQRPCVMVLDPEMLKQVTVKEFNTFVNREVSPNISLIPRPSHPSVCHLQGEGLVKLVTCSDVR